MRTVLLLLISGLFFGVSYGQGCCSGGAGSPIAGGAASGVLLPSQMELSTSYQANRSNVFYSGNSETLPLFESYKTDYTYFRTDYGISKRLTFSLASGYFFNKSYDENDETIQRKGIGDLLIFPRFNIYNQQAENHRTEITVGLGSKLPLGVYNDSLQQVIELPGLPDIVNYTFAPPIVQRSTGGTDLLFYTYWYRGYNKLALRFFANTLYIKKGYNDLGQKFGDYASVGFFASKTIWRNLGLTAQIKGELIKKMEGGEDVNLLAEYNIEETSTGSEKIFFIPQLSYSYKSLTGFITSEIPLYQNLNGTQIASQWQFTMGVNYRFLTKK